MTFQGTEYKYIHVLYINLTTVHAKATVNPEIFVVKVFSDTSKNPKIKNMKIPCSEIIHVFDFRTDSRIRKFFYSKISYTKIFGHENFRIYGIHCMYKYSHTCTLF